MPRTWESFVDLNRFDALVKVDVPTTGISCADRGDRGAGCTLHRLDHRRGSTLQIGLGRVPNDCAISRSARPRHPQRCHYDGVVDPVEAGVVTDRHKTRRPDRIVASYCLGTRRLYDFVDDNPRFLFLPIDQVCGPEEVARQSRMVSITQAFAIDLTGQVCVDQFEGEFYGGVSTQVGFIRGAARSLAASPSSALRPLPTMALRGSSPRWLPAMGWESPGPTCTT
jgi:acyl-CoA hydrolase